MNHYLYPLEITLRRKLLPYTLLVIGHYLTLPRPSCCARSSEYYMGPTRFHSFDVSAHVTVVMSSRSTYCHTVLQYDSNILRASWLVRDDVKRVKPNRISLFTLATVVLVPCNTVLSSTLVPGALYLVHGTTTWYVVLLLGLHHEQASLN
jgi:hypothetical protein